MDSKLTFEGHIGEKIAKAKQGLGLMKQLKKWVSSEVLEQVYKLYVRPHLDYGDVIYDIATADKTTVFQDNDRDLTKKVESIQYEAARVVTGAWKSTSIVKLYRNLGWESLSDRRTMRKLCLLYETIENDFPRQLATTIENQKHNENSRHYKQNLSQTHLLKYKNIFCNTNKYKLSFFPSVINDWNMLDDDTKNARSKNIFKKKLLNKIRPKKSSYFGLRDNDEVRYITMLRMKLSPLREHKHKYHFADTSDPFCTTCGCLENNSHYLLHCRSFNRTRSTLLQKISNIIELDFSSLPIREIIYFLLYGKEDLENSDNLKILKLVSKFIEKTKRLDTF